MEASTCPRCKTSGVPKQSRQQDLFNRFMVLLQENYMKEHGIKFYADKLFITPRYLSRIINEVSGHFAS